MQRENRRYPRGGASFAVSYRVLAPLEARSEFGEREREGLAEDISIGGLCLSIDHRIPAGAILSIRFRAVSRHVKGEEGSHKFELRGRACHCRAAEKHTYRVGIEFDRPSDAERDFIAGCI